MVEFTQVILIDLITRTRTHTHSNKLSTYLLIASGEYATTTAAGAADMSNI